MTEITIKNEQFFKKVGYNYLNCDDKKLYFYI